MDGEVLNQRVRKLLEPHAVMAQRAIAPAVREAAAGNRLEGALLPRPENPTATSQSPDRRPSMLAEPSRLPAG